MDAAFEAVIGGGGGMWRCNMDSGKHGFIAVVNRRAHVVLA